MAVQSQFQDNILNSAMLSIYNTYKYLAVSTGTVMPGTDEITLANSVQIGSSASLFNKAADTNPIYTNITGRLCVMQFELLSGEPYSQPVNIGRVGLVDAATGGAALGVAALLSSAFTKSNQLKAKFRVEMKIIKISEV